MFRPGMYGFQSGNGSSVMPMQQQPQQQQQHMAGPVPPHAMNGGGPSFGPPAFPGGHQQNFVQQQNMAYASHPPMPHQPSHAQPEFSTIAMQAATPSLAPQPAISEPQHFAMAPLPLPLPPPPPQPAQGPLFYGQPPRYPIPPVTNFGGAFWPRPPVDMPPPTFPPRPSFSPLVPPQPSSGWQLSQTLPPSHIVPQQMPQPPLPAGEFCQPMPPLHTTPDNNPQPPPPPPAFSVCQPYPSPQTQPFNLESTQQIHTPQIPTSEVSQTLTISTDISDPCSSSHSKPLPPPPHKPTDDEMIQNIEILSEFVVKNGPEFENMARARQAGNPKFSFLFNGTPGSDAAIGYQYFQWMKMKWELQMNVDHNAENGGKPSEQLERPRYTQQANDPTFESQAVPSSPAASDVDMEDDFAITAMPNKVGKDHYTTHVAGILSLGEEHNNASSNLILEAAGGGKKEELVPMNTANMEFSQSESQRKKELSHLAYGQQYVEEKIPVESTAITFQHKSSKATTIDDEDVNNMGYRNSIFKEEQQSGIDLTQGLNVGRSCQESEALANRYAGLIYPNSEQPNAVGFVGRDEGCMKDGKIECNKRQVFQHNDADKGLGKDDYGRLFSWNNDATEGSKPGITAGEIPMEIVKERTGSPVNEGTSDSESEEVLYTANGLKRGRRTSRSQSPGDNILRSNRQYRSRTRSPRRVDDTQISDEVQGVCLRFIRGTCYEGSTCQFVHHKAGASSMVDYSDEESEEPKALKEMERDLKGSIDGIKSYAAVADNANSTSPEKESNNHNNHTARDQMNQDINKNDDSSIKGEKSREWDVDLLSEPYSAYFDREIFQPSGITRKGMESQPLPRDDFRPLPLRKEDFEQQLVPCKDIPSQHFQREGLQPRQLQREELQPEYLRGEDYRVQHLHRELRRPSLLHQEDMRRVLKQPYLHDEIRSKPFIRDDLRAHPLFCEDVRARPLLHEDVALLREGVHAGRFPQKDIHARPILREDLHAHPSYHEDVHSWALMRGSSYGQSMPRGDFRSPSLVRDNLPPMNLLRKDIILDQFARSNLRLKDEELKSHSLLRDDIHFQHLIRERSRLHAGGLWPREDLHSRFLPREDIHLKALTTDLPSHRLDISTGKADPLRNSSIRQNSVWSENSSLLSRSDFMRSADPQNHREHHTLHSDFPFSINANTLSRQEPGILHTGPDVIPRLHTLSPHSLHSNSPPNINRTSKDWQLYQYSHPGVSSVSGPSTLRKSNVSLTSGVPYDPLFDSIETDMDHRLQNVNHEYGDGKNKTNLLVQSENAENNQDNVKADFAVQTPPDGEVGIVDNESPKRGGGRERVRDHPFDMENTGAGEIDMDQTHANEKTSNTKEIRAMKVFRTALADFVKELLKPSWREGHMSKEAFKTIVKKAVDKVAGTLQGHQIPNTQEKIDQYLELSRVKLTKLVEGYAEKYVNI